MSLRSLPPEVISSILDHTSKSELMSLCLTDRRTSRIVQPRLFRNFYLRDANKAVKYFLVIHSRPDLALSVWDFSFIFEKSGILPKWVWKCFLQLSSYMSNITALRFSCVPSGIIFRDVTFPRLKFFSSVKYFNSEFVDFLSRHPTVTELFLGCDITLDISPEFLPSLRCLMCTPYVAEKIVPGRPITELALTRNPISDERAAEIIKSLSLSSTPILRFSYTTFHNEETRIPRLTAIARYLPGLQTLHLNSGSMADALDKSFIDFLTSLLPSFKSLRRLFVPLVYQKLDANDLDTVCLESKLLAEWRKSSPELLYVAFPNSNIYMYDVSQMVWIRTDLESIPSESSTLLPYPF